MDRPTSFPRRRLRRAVVATLLVTQTAAVGALLPGVEAVGATTCLGRTPTITGTDRSETIRGTTGNDVIFGGGGNDIIIGNGGSDRLCGGGGNDTFWPQRTPERIDGGAGRDLVSFVKLTDLNFTGVVAVLGDARGNGFVAFADGSAAHVRLKSVEDFEGTKLDDFIAGGPGPNLIRGLGGGDVFTFVDEKPVANDDFVGGDGEDYALFMRLSSSVSADLQAGSVSGGTIGNDTISSVQHVIGSYFADRIGGTDEANILAASPTSGGQVLGRSLTDDELVGRGGDDDLYGSNGNTTVDGGDGNDEILDPGFGNDTVNGGAGNDKLEAPPLALSGVTTSSTYNGGPGDDSVRSGPGNDQVSGGDGRDVVRGNGGNDQVNGDADADRVFGDIGDDTVLGGAGIDIPIDGGQGTDTCPDADPQTEGAAGCTWASGPDTDLGDPAPAVETTDLSVAVTGPNAVAGKANEEAYTVTLTNGGPAITRPEGMELFTGADIVLNPCGATSSVGILQGYDSALARSAFCTVTGGGTLAPGQSVTWEFRVDKTDLGQWDTVLAAGLTDRTQIDTNPSNNVAAIGGGAGQEEPPGCPVERRSLLQTSSCSITLAGPEFVERGDEFRLTATLAPCPAGANKGVGLLREVEGVYGLLQTGRTNAECKAIFKVRIRRDTMFKARSPATDANNESNVVTVKVRVEPPARSQLR